jgi:predicted nucleotidyltransferase
VIEQADVEAVVWALRAAAEAVGAPFMLVGAYARDLRLEGVPGPLALRFTRDVDFAVMVETWGEFEHVRAGLPGRPEQDFAPGDAQHRLVFLGRLKVDLVPFGALMEADGTIRWPPDGKTVMSVLGFEDAYETATEMMLGPECVRVVTLAGLTLLKLVAWNDDRRRTKDAEDLALVLRKYPDAPAHEDRLWLGPDADLADAPSFDYETAGARLLGRDLARSIRRPPVLHAVGTILQREAEPPYDLGAAMKGAFGHSVERALGFLGALRQGVLDVPPGQGGGP